MNEAVDPISIEPPFITAGAAYLAGKVEELVEMADLVWAAVDQATPHLEADHCSYASALRAAARQNEVMIWSLAEDIRKTGCDPIWNRAVLGTAKGTVA